MYHVVRWQDAKKTVCGCCAAGSDRLESESEFESEAEGERGGRTWRSREGARHEEVDE